MAHGLLKPHNAEAYQKIKDMFNTEDRVCVSHATGTGKSFLAMQWLQDNANKKTLFLAPTYYIVEQFITHLQDTGLYEKLKDNLEFEIYHNLPRHAKKLSRENFEQIILDEFHRCGAKEWGKGLEKLLEKSKAKILGISATPIRHLDENRNMAQELFHGNVVSEITLPQAIQQGILPAPRYVGAIYSFEEDVKALQTRINKTKDQTKKKELQLKLDNIKELIAHAQGLPEIFAKHIEKKDGKFIVFCSDKKQLRQFQKEAPKWFKEVNPNIEMHEVHYKKGRAQNQEAIESFESADNNKLKLLFAVNLLNEGVHVKGIDGVVMMRPTSSRNIFLQQLGRALSASEYQTQPTIFDITNNILNSKENFAIIEEIQKAQIESESNNNRTKKDKTKVKDLQIFDELKQVKELLSELGNSLGDKTFDQWVELLKCCIKEKKYTNPEQQNKKVSIKRREKYEGESIGNWISWVRSNGTDEQKTILEKLGIDMTSTKRSYDDSISLISEHMEKDGDTNTKLKTLDKKLRTTINCIKQNGTDEQKKKLETLGIDMTGTNRSYNDSIDLISEHMEGDGDTNAKLKTLDKKLRRVIRGIKRSGTDEQKKKLSALGIDMTTSRKRTYDDSIDLISEHLKGDGTIKAKLKTLDKELRQTISGVKQFGTDEQKKKLSALGIDMTVQKRSNRKIEEEEKSK